MTKLFAFNPAITSGSSCFRALQEFQHYNTNERTPVVEWQVSRCGDISMFPAKTVTIEVGYQGMMDAETTFQEHRKPPATSIAQFDIAPVIESGHDFLRAVGALLDDLTKAVETYAWYWDWIEKIEKNYNELFSETEKLLLWIECLAQLGICAPSQLREANGAEHEQTKSQAADSLIQLLLAATDRDRIVYMESAV